MKPIKTSQQQSLKDFTSLNLNDMAQVVEVKKWYQSKIFLLAATLFFVAGGNLLFGFLSVNVTAEQLEAMRAAYPQAVEIIEKLKNGDSIFSVLGLVVSLLIAVFRVWFTPKLIPQSLPGNTK